MAHQARKRFGQHFLTEPDYIEKIVSAVAPAAGETIVEIGPGQAALTDPLAALATELHAIEFDRDLAAGLRDRFSGRENVIIHEGDWLEFSVRVSQHVPHQHFPCPPGTDNKGLFA